MFTKSHAKESLPPALKNDFSIMWQSQFSPYSKIHTLSQKKQEFSMLRFLRNLREPQPMPSGILEDN